MAESSEITVDRKLSEIFDEGFQLLENINKTSLPFNSPELQNQIQKCIGLFEDSTRLVSLIGIFSSNESFEEISTEYLKYLLLPFYLGQLSCKVSTRDRKEILSVAEVYYKDFLKRCEEYGICSSSNQIQSVIQEQNEGVRDLIQAASARNSKIEQYRQKKELQEQLSELKISVDKDHVDDEVKREFYTKMVKLAIIDAKEEIKSISQELEILSFKNSIELNTNPDDKEHKERNSSHFHVTRPKVEPLKPIIITKDAAQKAVFGMGYPSLPVMSVKDFYEERVREGIFPGAEQVEEMNKRMFHRESSVEKEEREKAEKDALIESDDPEYLERQRAMDEYKDVVRRGDGNRYNRS